MLFLKKKFLITVWILFLDTLVGFSLFVSLPTAKRQSRTKKKKDLCSKKATFNLKKLFVSRKTRADNNGYDQFVEQEGKQRKS